MMWPWRFERVVSFVVCGAGSNGGDENVVARWSVSVLAVLPLVQEVWGREVRRSGLLLRQIWLWMSYLGSACRVQWCWNFRITALGASCCGKCGGASLWG
nr:hypothetical protein [uncultured Neokomagataea sp.]